MIIVEPEDRQFSTKRVEHVPFAVGDIDFSKANGVEDEADAVNAEDKDNVHHQLYEFNNAVEYITDYIVPGEILFNSFGYQYRSYFVFSKRICILMCQKKLLHIFSNTLTPCYFCSSN